MHQKLNMKLKKLENEIKKMILKNVLWMIFGGKSDTFSEATEKND